MRKERNKRKSECQENETNGPWANWNLQPHEKGGWWQGHNSTNPKRLIWVGLGRFSSQRILLYIEILFMYKKKKKMKKLTVRLLITD